MNIFKQLFGANPSVNLKDLIAKGAFLLDVRTPQEFAEGFVKGSVNIPLDKVATQLATFKKQENIIVFCRSGNRSAQAKAILNQHGVSNVTNGGTWHNIQQVINH